MPSPEPEKQPPVALKIESSSMARGCEKELWSVSSNSFHGRYMAKTHAKQGVLAADLEA